jgi:signal transduction histidine kinase
MLNNLINDLLDMAKFENGKFIFNEKYFSLPMLVSKALNVIKYFADEKEIKLIIIIVAEKKQHKIIIGENENNIRESAEFSNILFNNLYGDERRYL